MELQQHGWVIVLLTAVVLMTSLPFPVSAAPALDPQKELRVLNNQVAKVEKALSQVGRTAKTLEKVFVDMEVQFKVIVQNVTRLQQQRDVLAESAGDSCPQGRGGDDGGAAPIALTAAEERDVVTTEPRTTAEGPRARDCTELLYLGYFETGVYTIYIGDRRVRVYCRMSRWPREAWTLIQRRQDGSVDFDRTWDEYKEGFGDPGTEYWLGNENIYQLTRQGNYKLYLYMEDWEGGHIHIEFDQFYLEGANYVLRLNRLRGGNTQNAMHYNTGQPFSTKDRDNDVFGVNCGQRYSGGWWYYGHACVYANLNGEYVQGGQTRDGVGLVWMYWRSPDWYSAKVTEMRVMARQP